MSTKRGRRNGKWHKEKSERRLRILRDELRTKSKQKEYIPLEEPVFAGWDVSIVVDGFRRDRLDLESVLNSLGFQAALFIRNKAHIRELRKNKHSFYSFLNLRSSYYYGRSFRIDEIAYNKLTEEAKKYFYIVYWGYFGTVKKYYQLHWSFPFYCLKAKIKKSYFQYRVVHDSLSQSEYDKLSNRLYLVDKKSGGNRWRDCFIKTNKIVWKNAMRDIVRNQYSPEEIVDNYSNIFKNVSKKRDYGWS